MNQEGTLGNAIRKARKENDYTLKQLGEELGVTHAYLSRIENNKVVPTDELLKKIAIALDKYGLSDYLNEFRVLAGFYDVIDEKSEYYENLKASGRLEIDCFNPETDLPDNLKNDVTLSKYVRKRDHKRIVEKPYYKLNYLMETPYKVFYDIKLDEYSGKIATIELPRDFIQELYKVINLKILDLVKNYPEILESISNPEVLKQYSSKEREKFDELVNYAYKNIDLSNLESFIHYFNNDDKLT
ncbi:helix-turn-helix domain-containing protein [Staphylococcus simulans]|uniref:helix-turn-helix domain-containing protein n=1 Tax=Staphylococcus simulans TaxID=1286 RepID=UPI0021D475E6|nr:helix-turn-helix transcriptional regulator [Staphylococcus simulans]UXR33665.1 helix-turn-helix domain-containing protein [Staphylococcus simulans]